jgi:hypothetical protein
LASICAHSGNRCSVFFRAGFAALLY